MKQLTVFTDTNKTTINGNTVSSSVALSKTELLKIVTRRKNTSGNRFIANVEDKTGTWLYTSFVKPGAKTATHIVLVFNKGYETSYITIRNGRKTTTEPRTVNWGSKYGTAILNVYQDDFRAPKETVIDNQIFDNFNYMVAKKDEVIKMKELKYHLANGSDTKTKKVNEANIKAVEKYKNEVEILMAEVIKLTEENKKLKEIIKGVPKPVSVDSVTRTLQAEPVETIINDVVTIEESGKSPQIAPDAIYSFNSNFRRNESFSTLGLEDIDDIAIDIPEYESKSEPKTLAICNNC